VRTDTPLPNNNEPTAVLPTESSTNEDGEMFLSYPLPSGVTGNDPLNEFQFDSEMGPVADMSTFPPTMANPTTEDNFSGMMSMDSILTNNFWDSVLVPGAFDFFFGLQERLT
jgi:hypothetical protein